jgi:hypothetical protein
MTLTQIQENNITNEELEIIEEWTDGLSDFCEMTDGTWGIEWDGSYGRHWDRYATEAEAEAALDRHSARQLELLPEARAELARRKEAAKQAAIEKGRRIAAHRRFIKEQKTLGGHCPELAALLSEMRKK